MLEGRSRAPPVGRVDVLDTRRRPGDAGVVDQHVEAAQLRDRLVEEGVDLVRLGDVAVDRAVVRALGPAALQRRLRDIADPDPGAVVGEGIGDGPADAGRAGGDQHSKTGLEGERAAIGHGLPPVGLWLRVFAFGPRRCDAGRAVSSGRLRPGATPARRRILTVDHVRSLGRLDESEPVCARLQERALLVGADTAPRAARSRPAGPGEEVGPGNMFCYVGLGKSST